MMKFKSSKQFEYLGVLRITHTSGRTARFAVLSYRRSALVRELEMRDVTRRSHTATALAFVAMATLVVYALGVSMDSIKSGQICFKCAEDRSKLYISLPSLIVSILIPVVDIL